MSDPGARRYVYGTFAIGFNKHIITDQELMNHDILLGAFTRTFAGCEYSMKQIIIMMLKSTTDNSLFMMSKLSAGQVAGLFREIVKESKDEEIKKFGTGIANQYLAQNEFRNQISHGLHVFSNDSAGLLKYNAKNEGIEINFSELSSSTMDAMIRKNIAIHGTLTAIMLKLNGCGKPMRDIITNIEQGLDPATGERPAEHTEVARFKAQS